MQLLVQGVLNSGRSSGYDSSVGKIAFNVYYFF
jgi:hypothetical protein